MHNIFKISAASLLAIFLSLLIMKFGLVTAALVPAVAILLFNYHHPLTTLIFYLYLLPFFPDYIGIDLRAFGIMHGVRLLNFLFLIPLLLRRLREGHFFYINKRLFFIDILVFLFLFFSVIGNLLTSGFGVWKGRFYLVLVDYFLIYLAITRYISTKDDLLKMTDILIYSCLALCVFGLFDYFLKIGFYTKYIPYFFPGSVIDLGTDSLELLRYRFMRLQVSFAQPLSLGIYVTAMHILILFRFYQIESSTKKALYVFSFLLSFFCLILAQARGPLLVDIVMVFFCLLFLKKYRLLFNIMLFSFSFAGLVLLFSIFSDIGHLEDFISTNLQRDSNVFHRLDLYQNILAELSRASLFGENKNLINAVDSNLRVDIVVWYLQILIDSGIVALMIYFVLIGYVIILLFSSCWKSKDTLSYAYLFSLLSMLGNFLSVSFVGQVRFYFFLIFSAGICIFVYHLSFKQEFLKDA